MLNWLANALATRIRRVDDAKIAEALEELRIQREESRRETRALISEMEDMLEKFSRVVARQAMRRSRAMKNVLEADLEEQPQQQPQQQEIPLEQLPPAERKAALRRKFSQQLRHQGGNQ